MSEWWVYIVRCRDRSLYTGIALDVDRRLAEHRRGDRKGAKYLRGRGPLRLVLATAIGPKPLALRVEHRLKRLRKAEKEALIRRVRRGSDPGFATPTVARVPCIAQTQSRTLRVGRAPQA